MESRCLTVYQPWAGFLVKGIKKFETRGQPISYRGRVYIHAGKAEFSPEMGIWPRMPGAAGGMPLNLKEHGVVPYLGAIVGHADLVACREVDLDLISGLSQLEFALGNYEIGAGLGRRFVWEMANPVELTMPIPMSGKQGLWKADLSQYGY